MNLSDDFDWTPEEVAKYQIVYPTIPQARWDRARDVDCRDLILELTGASNRGNKISCPFHGRDRRPSFQLYPNTNSCWCFGCDPKESPTDPISFVAKFYEINKLEAMKWIENHYSLPEIEDEIEEEEKEEEEKEEEETIRIEYKDIKEAFLDATDGPKDYETAIYLINIFFNKDILAMAQVIGKEEIQEILKAKARKPTSQP